MFEGILERVLQRALGDYLEGLDKKNLSLGVWSGNINLENVHFKRSIFQKLKLPLTLRLGRIGKLQMIVPWRSLSSSPVEVIINNVNIIITPQNKEEWQLIETFHTNYEMRQQMITQFAAQLYSQLIKSQEAEQQEQGFFKSLVTKILDNVQLTIQNIHVRLESSEKLRSTFSMGLTLKEITIHTTNQTWQKEYFDRTQESNKDKPVFKVLNIVKLGLYWRTNEDRFLTQEYDEEDDMLIAMRDCFQNEDDYIQEYKDFYLLQPISLYMKLKQNIASQALEKEAEYQISLEVDEFSIYLQKTQYDNLIKLMDQQTRKYKFLRPIGSTPQSDPKSWIKFCCECIKREIRQNRTKINQFQIDNRVKQTLKSQFQQIFKKVLEIEIQNLELPEKSQIKAREDFWIQNHEILQLYQYITQAIDYEELIKWTEEVAKNLSDEFKEKEKQSQLNNQGGGFLRYFTQIGSSWLGGGPNEIEEQNNQQLKSHNTQISQSSRKKSLNDSFKSENSGKSEEDDEFYDALDEVPGQQNQQDEYKNLKLPMRRKPSISDELSILRESLLVNFTPYNQNNLNEFPRKKFNQQAVIDLIKMNSEESEQKQEKYREMLANQIPFVQANFILKLFSVSLVNNEEKQEGIELFSRNFMIDFKKFETNNTQNLFTFEVVAKNQEFGINQLLSIEGQTYKSSIISSSKSQKEELKQDQYQSVIRLIKGNLNQNVSQKQIIEENFDFDLDVKFQPLKIVYQVKAISKLVKFFKIKTVKEDEIKQQAYEKLEALKQSVSITDVLKNRKKNRIKIEIASPIIILPFKKNNDINSECWVFNMGDFSIQNYGNKADPDLIKNYDPYKIQVAQIMMKYVKSYKQWLTNESQGFIEVIKPFKTQLILQLRRRSDTQNLDEAEIVATGKMSKLSIFFTPHIYNSILNISLLLSSTSTNSRENEQQQMINEKNEVMKIASKIGQIRKKGGTIKFWYQYFGVLSGGYIYFYEKQSDMYPSEYFYIKGSQIVRDFDKQIEHTLLLVNMFGEQCLVSFNSYKNQLEWEKAILDKVFEYQQVGQDNTLQRQSLITEKKYSLKELEKKLMRFEFQMPQIQIELVAEPINREEKFKDSHRNFESQESQILMTDNLDAQAFDIGLFTPIKKMRDSTVSNKDQKRKTTFNEHDPFSQAQNIKDQIEEFEDETIKEHKWQALIVLESIKISLVKRLYDQDITVVLQSLSINNYMNKRFQDMMCSEFQINKKALIEIKIQKQEKESPRYQNQDMTVDLVFGQLSVFWHPKSINRLLRFFRYHKLPAVFLQEEQDKILLKQNMYSDQNQDTPVCHRMGSEIRQVQNCFTFPNTLVKVNCRLDNLKIVLIHPINETYPISSLMLGRFQLDYEMCFDHDSYQGSFGEFKIYDHTNFPLTLDPRKTYENPDYPNHEILGLRNEFVTENMMTFQCLIHHEPEDRICPRQQGQFDKQVKLGLNGIKVTYLQEPMMRINDYFFSQFLGALSDSNPYQSIIDDLQDANFVSNSPQSAPIQRESLISFKGIQNLHEDQQTMTQRSDKQPTKKQFSFVNMDEMTGTFNNEYTKTHQNYQPSPSFNNKLNSIGNLDYDSTMTFNQTSRNFSSKQQFQNQSQKANKQKESQSVDNKWLNFDLKQYKFCTGLDITIDRPLIVLKDRPYLQKNIEIDLGKTNITSETMPVQSRWKSMPEKDVWVTKFNIDMKEMGIRFDHNRFEIAPSYDMKIVFEKLNQSPYLEESFNSKHIDFTDLDISYKIQISFSALVMHLRQDVYTYLLRCVDLNINYTDNLTKYFQLAIWNDGSDTQKYITQEQEMVKKHKNKDVHKMKIYMSFPSLALQLRNMDGSYMSEFILWSADIDFLRYVDYRKTIIVKSHTIFILHNEQSYELGSKMKQVVVAPVSSKNFICTNSDFYNFQHSHNINKLSPQKRHKAHAKLSKKNFVVNIHLEADGEKLIQTKIEKLKIFIKPHIFLLMFEMFVYSMPQYQDDSRDKPNFFDSDYGNAPRMEVCCQILQSLLCFENEVKYQKTIACQGNTSFTYIREKVNQIKLRLIDKPNLIDEFSYSESGKSQNSSRRNSVQMNQSSVTLIDTSATTKIMQISISDLCPFFCSGSDLDGKNFKQVRKREMMSPFTLFYNRSDIIELSKQNDRLYLNSPDKYIFKNYSKVEANLERTLLKISFNDIQVLKGIVDHLGFMLNQEYMRIVNETQGQDRIELEALQDDDDYLKTYSDAQMENLQASSFPKKLFQIDEQTEKSNNHQSNNINEESSFLTSDSEDFENEEETRLRLAKIQKQREQVLKTQKAQVKADNFTESVKRASVAFNRLQHTFTLRQKDFQKHQDLIINEDIKIPYMGGRQKLNKSQDVIQEEDEMDDLDVDEGQVTTNMNMDQQHWKHQSPNASKSLMSNSDFEIDSTTQNFLALLQAIKEERGVDQFQVVSYGLKVLIINDYLQNFFPVLGMSISEFHYSSDQNETQKAGITQFSSAINYYNAEAGEWEPFIETFKIHFTIMEEFKNQKRMMQCELPQSLSLNITEKLVKNLSNTYKSWLSSSDEDTQQQQNTKKTNEYDQFQSDRGGTVRKRISSTFKQYTFEDIDEEEEFDQTQKEEDVVTPYSICNQTNQNLLVKRLNNINDREVTDKKSKRNLQSNIQSMLVKGGVGQEQSKLNRVYVINPGEAIDYAVDYELQVKQQMNIYNSHQFSGQQGEFIKILFEDAGPEKGGITSGSGMSIPLSSVNLNQVGCKKHFVKDDERLNHSEFYVYGVTQVNMKKVLTIRTQYLFVNQTFFNYEIHIRFSNSSITRSLAPGDRLPIPDTINQCKFQIRIASQQNHIEAEEETGGHMTPNLARRISKKQNQNNDESVLLEEALNQRGDIQNFQIVSRNWSDLLPINALKLKLPVDKTTFLKHGKTFTIIKKEKGDFIDAYDITFRPPLILKNCLPVPIMVTFEDSNGEYDSFDLLKEEEKHVFVFNLQQPVMIKVLIEGFKEQLVVLDCQTQKDLEIKVQVYDNFGRTLDLYIATNTKVAGKKAIFYVKNCVINNTQQDLSFYYTQPNERQIKQKNYKDMVAGADHDKLTAHAKKVFLLSDRQEIFGSIEGSQEVSNPLNIFNPGCNDKFMLSKDNQLFEFAYQTEIFLATKDDYVYTKITTITPLYVFVNHTKNIIVAAQFEARDIPFVIPSKERVPFHWANIRKEKYVAIKMVNDTFARNKQELEYQWSSGFDISQLGQISIQMREVVKEKNNTKDYRKFKAQRQKIKYLKIDRRLHNNTIFIIVEEEDITQPTYKIENFSKILALRYHQVDQTEFADLLNVQESTAFSWSNHLEPHDLQVDLFHGDLNTDQSYYIQGVQLKFALDQLNQKLSYLIQVGYQDTVTLHVCTFTNGYTKVIRFSDIDNTHITATNQEDKGNIVDENLSQMAIYEFNLKQLNLSLIGENKELMIIYFQRIQAKVVDTEIDTKSEFEIGYLQIDNQSQNDPIYPVMLKPKYIKPEYVDDEENSLQKKDHFRSYQIGVFQLSLDYRKNIPHVAYFELVDYLLQTLEVKLEFSHILLLSKFASKIGTLLNKNLTWMHQIFEQESDQVNKEIEPEFFRMKEDVPKVSHHGQSHSQSVRYTDGIKLNLDQYKSDNFQPTFDLINEEENKEEVKLNLSAKDKRSKFHRIQSQDQALLSRQLKQRTIASSLNLNRGQSMHEGKSSSGYYEGITSSLTKQKSSRQDIMRKLHSQDFQILHQQTKVQRQNWKSEQFKQKSQRIYIKEYKAGPVELEVSLMNTESFELEESSDIFKTVSSLGLVISSIDEAPIKLNALVLENVFGEYDDVITQLRKHHSERFKWNILKFIGASNLLGNPSNFVNALGTGVQDFFYQPRQGFVKGPIQGGIGIIKGTGSLVKNTLIGTIGSASKMVSSVSKGLLVLSNDKEYIQRRDVENIKKKPQNVGQGLSLGLKSAFNSIKSGITGVYRQPMEESKKSGFSGFFKGTAKGITGLVVKPISGTLDLFSLTSEGIKNTSKNIEELTQDKRLRLPRPFYETERIIREYDDFHAFWVNQVPRIRPDINVEFFYEATMIDCSEYSWSILFLTMTNLAMIVAEQNSAQSQRQQNKRSPVFIKWCYDTKQIQYAEVVEDSLLTIGFQDKNLSIQLHDQILAERVRTKIEKIIKINQQ
eukprot:403375355